MQHPHILIEVRGGLIQCITSTSKDVQISVIDYDNLQAAHDIDKEQYEPPYEPDQIWTAEKLEQYIAKAVPTLHNGETHPVENILRVIDIFRDNLSPATIGYLKGLPPVYLDTTDSEHIYHVNDIVENIKGGHFLRPSEEVMLELDRLETILNRHEASYIRITKTL